MSLHTGTKNDPYRISNLELRYWNDNFGGTTYSTSSLPTGSDLNGTYTTREALASAYSNWSTSPYYVKTAIFDGDVINHQACLWYNNREFCFEGDYWDTNGTTTMNKLQADMESALGVSATNCTSSSGAAYCYFGDFDCHANSSGHVACGGGGPYCTSRLNGSAWCVTQ